MRTRRRGRRVAQSTAGMRSSLSLCHHHCPEGWPSIRITAKHTANILILVKKPPIEVWGVYEEMVVIRHCVQTTLSTIIWFHIASSDSLTNRGTEHIASARSNGYDWNTQRYSFKMLIPLRWQRWRRRRENRADGGKDNQTTTPKRYPIDSLSRIRYSFSALTFVDIGSSGGVLNYCWTVCQAGRLPRAMFFLRSFPLA